MHVIKQWISIPDIKYWDVAELLCVVGFFFFAVGSFCVSLNW